MAGDAWSNRPLDPGWAMLPGGKGRTRPDGSTEWNLGEGPGGYEDATENQAKQTRQQLGQIDSQQANRWDKFGTSNRPPAPDEVAQRRTRQWRDAFDKEQNWLTAMAQHGASPSDLGLEAKVGRGLANFSRWGEITDYAKQEAQKGNWIDPNKYGANPNLAFRRPEGGGGGGGGRAVSEQDDSGTPAVASGQYGSSAPNWGGWGSVFNGPSTNPAPAASQAKTASSYNPTALPPAPKTGVTAGQGMGNPKRKAVGASTPPQSTPLSGLG